MRRNLSPGARPLVLHASAVASPYGALLFGGPSGTGKSSIARLLERGAGWPIMADEVTEVWQRGDRWIADDGSPAASMASRQGKLAHPDQRGTPIRAWFSLRQASSASDLPLSGRETCAAVVQAWLEVAGHSSPYDPVRGLKVFPYLVALARTIPARTLHFTLGDDTVDLVRTLSRHATTGEAS